MTSKQARTDRVISVNAQIFARLTERQTELTERLGFKPTIAQVIESLLRKNIAIIPDPNSIESNLTVDTR